MDGEGTAGPAVKTYELGRPLHYWDGRSPNQVRWQRGERSQPRSRSLSPSSYKTPFYLSGPSQTEASALN